MYRRGLTRHVRRNHADHPVFDCNQSDKSFARSGYLEQHKQTFTCGGPAAKKQRVAVPVAAVSVPVATEFVLRETCRSLGGAVKQFTVDTREVNHLSALKDAIPVFTPTMSTFQQKHHAYKFQFAVDVVFHKAAVVTQPPVALTSKMIAVYPDLSPPPLEDVYRQLFYFIVYEPNGSCWVFSYFASIQLTLWHLDPLRARAFVPLPRWIQEKIAVVNIVGTGDNCFKWAVLAGMHPVGNHRDRMSKYKEHVGKYDFSPLRFPVPLSSIGSFAVNTVLSINVYGVENDEKVIYPLRVSQTVVPGRHVEIF